MEHDDKEFSHPEEFQQFVVDQFATIAETLRGLQSDMRSMHDKQDDMSDVMQPLAKAFDQTSVQVIQHERRIARLEKRTGIVK